MSKSVFIQELVRDGDRWRMSIREVGSTEELWREMYPLGARAPQGVTIEEEMIQLDPELIGHFFISGLTEQAVVAMEQGFAAAFRDAGFHGGPAGGMIRTWLKGIEQPWDMPENEAAQLYCDNYVDVRLPKLSEMTIWDPVLEQLCEFRYSNGKTFSVKLRDIQPSDAPADFLRNDSNFLIVPVDRSWQPVLNARTTLNMLQFRLKLEQEDSKIRDQVLEIGEMVFRFVKIVHELGTQSQWSNPVDVYRAGLRPWP